MELANRLDIETRLASRLAILSASQRRAILSAIGNPPRADELTEEFWADLERQYREELAAQGLIIYLLMLGQWWDEWQPLAARIPTDAGLFGGTWASGWASDRAAQWTSTSRERVGRLLFTQPIDAGPESLRAALLSAIGPNRIAAAAITGVTEAASAGSLGARDAFRRKLGVTLTGVWRTEADARVCPICRPLNGLIEPAWVDRFPNGPPAHPLCRCHLDFVSLGNILPSRN